MYMGTPNLSCVCKAGRRGSACYSDSFSYSSCFGMKQSAFEGCAEPNSPQKGWRVGDVRARFSDRIKRGNSRTERLAFQNVDRDSFWRCIVPVRRKFLLLKDHCRTQAMKQCVWCCVSLTELCHRVPKQSQAFTHYEV
jgi:hypothetical protein